MKCWIFGSRLLAMIQIVVAQENRGSAFLLDKRRSIPTTGLKPTSEMRSFKVRARHALFTAPLLLSAGQDVSTREAATTFSPVHRQEQTQGDRG